MTYRVLDVNEKEIRVGDRVFDSPNGTVTAIHEPDEFHHARVEVTYDDGVIEVWFTEPVDPGYSHYQCDNVELMS
jgi:hypothetical protein